MKAYPKYKNTSIDWIGEIPEHWDITKLKRILVSQTNGIWGDEKKGDEDDLAVIRVADFDYDKFKINYSDLTYRNIDKNKAKERLLKKNDIIIEKSGGGEKTPVGRAIIFDENLKAVTSNFLAKLTLKEDVDSKFIVYQLSDLYEKSVNLKSIKQTTGIQNLDFENYSLEEISLPTFEEQKKIGRFITYKLRAINNLISKNNQLIKLLEEKKQAIINQAVTKGLDQNAKMKDSGIEWIGEIPEHWDTAKIKFSFKFLDSQRIPLSAEQRGQMEEKTYDYYGASGVIDKVEEYLFDEPLLLIGEDGANLLNRTKRLVFIADGKYWVNNHAHVLKPNEGSLKYFEELIELIDVSIYVTGSAQPKLTQDSLANITIPIPPIKDQEQISLFTAKKSLVIQQKISILRKQNLLLKEYRQALISNAVTGKIDVRDEPIPEEFIKDQAL